VKLHTIIFIKQYMYSVYLSWSIILPLSQSACDFYSVSFELASYPGRAARGGTCGGGAVAFFTFSPSHAAWVRGYI